MNVSRVAYVERRLTSRPCRLWSLASSAGVRPVSARSVCTRPVEDNIVSDGLEVLFDGRDDVTCCATYGRGRGCSGPWPRRSRWQPPYSRRRRGP